MVGQERGVINIDLFDIQRQVITRAHESELMALALNYDGSLVASASEKGTLIRVFSTSSGMVAKSHDLRILTLEFCKGEMLHELRRGAERAIIHSICFNSASAYLACSSDKGTIHVFSLLEDEEGEQNDTSDGTREVQGRDGRYSAQSSIRNTFIPGNAASPDKQESFISNTIGGLFRKVLPNYFKSRWSIAQVSKL